MKGFRSLRQDLIKVYSDFFFNSKKLRLIIGEAPVLRGVLRVQKFIVKRCWENLSIMDAIKVKSEARSRWWLMVTGGQVQH